MWYNIIVKDVKGNILVNEKYYDETLTTAGCSYGFDVLGNWVEEWWE